MSKFYLFCLYSLCISALNNNLLGKLSKKEKAFIEKYSIPDSKIKEILDATFSRITDPAKALLNSNFEILKNSHFRIIATHPDANEFVIKAKDSSENKLLRFLWPNTNIRRIEIAENIRKYIKKNKLEKYLVVPQKWIYHIPNTKEDLNDYNYIVIAQKLELTPKGLNFFTQEQQNIIFDLIENQGLFDPNCGNIFLLTDGRIGFIDTEPPRRISAAIPLLHKLPFVRFWYQKDNANRGIKRFFKGLSLAIKENRKKQKITT